MTFRTLTTILATFALSFNVFAQEVMEEAGPYVPLATDVTDISALIGEEEFEIALDSLEVLMAKDTLDDALWYYYGVSKYATGERQEGIRAIERAIELDPSNSIYYESLYTAYNGMGTRDYNDLADSLCVVMADRFPKKFRNAYSLCLMADNALYNQRKDTLALRYYEEALAIDDTYAPALLGKAEVCRVSHNFVGFFSTMEEFAHLEHVPSDMKCPYIEHYLEMMDGQTYRIWHKQIDALVDACPETHPTDSSALVMAGRWFYSTGQKEKGISYFLKWKISNPYNYYAAELIISLAMNEGNDELVVKLCDEGLERFTEPEQQVSLLCIKGDTLYKLGKKGKSYRCYEKALKINPDEATVLNNYAYFLSLERRNMNKAAKMSKRSVELDPENVSFLDTYGYILYLQKRYAEAKTYFKKAIIRGGKEDEAVLRHYTLVLEKLGEKELASYYRGLYEAKIKNNE